MVEILYIYKTASEKHQLTYAIMRISVDILHCDIPPYSSHYSTHMSTPHYAFLCMTVLYLSGKNVRFDVGIRKVGNLPNREKTFVAVNKIFLGNTTTAYLVDRIPIKMTDTAAYVFKNNHVTNV